MLTSETIQATQPPEMSWSHPRASCCGVGEHGQLRIREAQAEVPPLPTSWGPGPVPLPFHLGFLIYKMGRLSNSSRSIAKDFWVVPSKEWCQGDHL